MDISVVICTHNPRADYLTRTLAALREQSLDNNRWELLLVDNASKVPQSGQWDLSWHPNSRHIRESELGLTPARLRGIHESTGRLLVFVDDDNVLDPEYLKEALRVYNELPFIQIFGGSIRGEFESSPPPWIKQFLPYLAISEITAPIWGNSRESAESLPCGAGLCIHRDAALRYALQVAGARRSLDRVGTNLSSCGDTDMVLTTISEGSGAGRFPNLSLIHLIPKERIELAYLLRLSRGIAYSSTILRSSHGLPVEKPTASTIRTYIGTARRLIFWPRITRLKFEARREGIRSAALDLAT